MKVHYNQLSGAPGGVTSSISWDNPVLHDALHKAFACKSSEVITDVWVNREGIKVNIAQHPNPIYRALVARSDQLKSGNGE